MDGATEGPKDRLTDIFVEIWMDGLMYCGIDGRKDGWNDGQNDGQMDGWIHHLINE